jgi:hypothetical protein
MELILSDEQKKLVKRAALLAKSYKPKRPEINLRFQVEQGGGLEPDWHGSVCNVDTELGEKDIDYDQFYDLIFEFVEDNMDAFFEPFNLRTKLSVHVSFCCILLGRSIKRPASASFKALKKF